MSISTSPGPLAGAPREVARPLLLLSVDRAGGRVNRRAGSASPAWDRLGEELEESVAEEAAEAVGRPAAGGGKAVEDGRVHEQPHDVDGLGAVEAGSQRCLSRRPLTIQPAVTARWARSCTASGTRRSSPRAPSRAVRTSASDRSAAGTRTAVTASRKAVASGAARADAAHGRSRTGIGSSSPAMATSMLLSAGRAWPGRRARRRRPTLLLPRLPRRWSSRHSRGCETPGCRLEDPGPGASGPCLAYRRAVRTAAGLVLCAELSSPRFH